MDRRIGLGLGVMMLGGMAFADGSVQQVPIAEYLASQGTTSNWMPPFPDFGAWTSHPKGANVPAGGTVIGGNAGSCDYLGVVNKTLVEVYGMPDIGTSFSGSVTKRPLSDGRILVQVNVLTSNAYAFANLNETFDFRYDTLLFGNRWDDLVMGATPAIGECHSAFSWKQPAGPLLDFGTAFSNPDIEIVDYSFWASATGPLTAAAGLGPDGTPGKMTITQTGFNRTTYMGMTADWWPAENVELRRVGK